MKELDAIRKKWEADLEYWKDIQIADGYESERQKKITEAEEKLRVLDALEMMISDVNYYFGIHYLRNAEEQIRKKLGGE